MCGFLFLKGRFVGRSKYYKKYQTYPPKKFENQNLDKYNIKGKNGYDHDKKIIRIST